MGVTAPNPSAPTVPTGFTAVTALTSVIGITAPTAIIAPNQFCPYPPLFQKIFFPRQPFPNFFVYFADINFKMIYKQHKSIPIIQAQFIASQQLRGDSNLYRRNILHLYGAVSNRPLQLNLHTISNNIKPSQTTLNLETIRNGVSHRNLETIRNALGIETF